MHVEQLLNTTRPQHVRTDPCVLRANVTLLRANPQACEGLKTSTCEPHSVHRVAPSCACAATFLGLLLVSPPKLFTQNHRKHEIFMKTANLLRLFLCLAATFLGHRVGQKRARTNTELCTSGAVCCVLFWTCCEQIRFVLRAKNVPRREPDWALSGPPAAIKKGKLQPNLLTCCGAGGPRNRSPPSSVRSLPVASGD